MSEHVLRHPRNICAGLYPLFERSRDGADTPLKSRIIWQQAGKNTSQAIRVAQPLLVHPIGKVDFLLDPLFMKHTVGKAVDCEDIEVLFVQESLKGTECLRVLEICRSLRRQAQADSKRTIPVQPLTYRRQ